MRTSLLTVTLLALLAGCSTVTASSCPTLIPYTQEFQDRLADAIERGVAVEISDVLRDYAGLRDQVRACQNSAD